MPSQPIFEVKSVGRHGITPVYSGPSLGAAIAAKEIALFGGAHSATVYQDSAAIQTNKQFITQLPAMLGRE